MNGSQKWPVTAWQALLELALGALDELDGEIAWTLGGGTALALKLHHRISYDIDIFLENAQHLHALSPNRNEASRAITHRWQDPGHYLKLERDEGEIDFILGARLTDAPAWSLQVGARAIAVEHPVEVVAKKLKYRGSRLLPRDIFDIIAVDHHDATFVDRAVWAVPDGARRAADRIERMAERYRTTIHREVNPTTSGLRLLDIDPLGTAMRLVDALP